MSAIHCGWLVKLAGQITSERHPRSCSCL